jgi:rhamnogalacturonan endolyase
MHRHQPSFDRVLFRCLFLLGFVAAGLVFIDPASANQAGAIIPNSPNVTVTQNADGTVVMGNGIVSITIVGDRARLDSATYTYNNTGTSKTTEMLSGKGQYYWGGEVFAMGNGQYKVSVDADPASNNGDYGDVMEISDSPSRGLMEIHFSMLRGSPGYYSTGIQTHRAQDDVMGLTAWGVVTRVPPEFNWLSSDEWRNFFIGEPSSSGIGVPNSPHEITIDKDGAKASEYADKFIYGQDHGDQRAWGWSSVGPNGLNVGSWMMTDMDFSDGGPLKRDVTVYPYSNLNNSILTGELGQGSDGNFAAGELWTKTCGPFFIYMNNIPASITDPAKAARALYDDALAQAVAEAKAWPYSWFKNDKYPPASGRGTVSGKFVINDSGNPGASAAGLWVGLEEQPATVNGTNDFQKWLKCYQYWVKSDADGNFKITSVLPGQNYTLYAFGPGAAGTFVSQVQQGGNPPLECNVPAKPFAVQVTPGTTTNLGDVSWTPVRVGATVFQLGFPDRKAGEFRHGEDFWTPGKTPKFGYPTPVWGGQMEFPIDFPDGLTYTVGKSRWDTDWNYVLPSLPDTNGDYQVAKAAINFDLAKAPADDAQASLYIAAAGGDTGRKNEDKIQVSINGTDLSSAAGVTGAPDPMTPVGYDIAYSDDCSIHFGDHGPFSDERINFPASMLHPGQNTITIVEGSKGLSSNLMVDYLRLEVAGYVPPAPASVTAYAGNGKTLVSWPTVPGAASYDVLRSTKAGSGYSPVVTGKIGAVAGSDVGTMTYTDTTAANGTPYYYAVVSANAVGKSAASPASAAVTPAATAAADVPAAPQGLKVTSSGHHSVALTWTASPGANYYSVSRATMYPNGVGVDYPLRTIVLNDAMPNTTFTDTTPTDGRIYNYFVQATNAAGTSAPSSQVTAKPVAPPPAAAPADLAGSWVDGRDGAGVTLKWSPVPGAVGYVVYRSAQDAGTFNFPADFVTALVETTYTDRNKPPKKGSRNADTHLLPSSGYTYQVTAVNSGGISPPATVDVGPKN